MSEVPLYREAGAGGRACTYDGVCGGAIALPVLDENRRADKRGPVQDHVCGAAVYYCVVYWMYNS